jgi:hypothetical protein
MLNRLILEDRDRKISDLRKTGEDVDIQVPKFFEQYRFAAVILTLLFQGLKLGATILRIMTFSIMTLKHYAECHCA